MFPAKKRCPGRPAASQEQGTLCRPHKLAMHEKALEPC
jgi:hypothetical protein